MEFKPVDIHNFKIIYNNMTEQFPPEELKSYARFCELIEGGHYFVKSVIEDGQPVGYIVFTIAGDSLWLDYIAVFKQFHSKGYGGRILKALLEEFKKGIYLEVEKPDKNVPNTLRRIKFYTNLGAQKLDYDYFYPSGKGPLPMDLYYLPYKGILPEHIDADIKETFAIIHSDIEYLNSSIQ